MRAPAHARRRISGAALAGAVVSLTGVLLASMAYAISVGSAELSLSTVLEVVARRMHLGDFDVTRGDDRIVWRLRAPRVVGAAAVGAGLALAGAVLQSLTRNDLADPYLLGLSGGATLGAVLVIVSGVSLFGVLGNAMVGLGAFIGALVALFLVLMVASGGRGALAPARTVLAGVAIGQIAAAYTSFLVIRSDDSHAAQNVLRWTLGSMAGFRWDTALFVLVASGLAIVGVLAFAKDLDAFAFGENTATSLGISVTKVRWILMVGTALLTAMLVAFAGAIGFVGLVVPHVVRIFVGPVHRRLLPISALVGATLLVWGDAFARTAIDRVELPIGIVTAGLGAPVFAYLLWRGAKR